MPLPPVRIVTDITEVADAIKLAHRQKEGASPRALGRTVFFIGAGCSVTAGVPGAPDIARRMVREIARNLFDAQSDDPDECLEHIHRERPFPELALLQPGQPVDWYAIYDAMFKRYYSGPDDARDLFDTLVDDARGAINWAHLCLGEIVKRRLVSTVITTNFDQLALAGMVRAGVLPVVCDGLETLNRIAGQSRHPQLIELHGSRHTYFLRNRPEDVAAVGSDQGGTTAVRSIFQHARNIVVVGYGGREDGVMDVLVRAARDFSDKHIFWVAYSQSPADLSQKAQDFLATSRNAGLLLGQDADTFFLDLCRILRVGAPGTIARPLETIEAWIGEASRATANHPDIAAELAAANDRLRRFTSVLAETAMQEPEAEIAARIREARLAGNLAGAWKQAEAMMLAIEGDTTGRSKDLLREIAATALRFGVTTSDRAPLGVAINIYMHLSSTASSANHRANLLVNLGNALQTLGEREDNPQRLHDAVAAYRDALKVYTREALPLDWAGTQNNLGNALGTLGAREDNPKLLHDAVAAYRDALTVYTREVLPLDWAMTQNNLGSALGKLGECEDNPQLLHDAIIAYHEALTVRTHEALPLDWAATITNLADTMRLLAVQKKSCAWLNDSRRLVDQALIVFERGGAEGYRAVALNILAAIERDRAALGCPDDPVDDAVTN